ncbi:MAG: hypothetical protein KDK36_20135, partial [Leptospiraceae bacterium]|nr:hypothetical protein [Leptospiraceae bacterium]
SKELKKGFDELADEIESKESTGLGAPTLSERGQEYKKEFSGGVDSFVIGYVNIDEYYKKAFNDAGENLSGGAFSEAIGKATKFAGEMNSGLTDSLSEVVFNYGEGTGKEFSKSSGYMSDVSDGAGLSFAVLKSFASITKGIFYDAIIKPVVQLGAITVGYVAVNAVIYPVMITTISGVSVTYVAIEVFKVGGKGIIYLVAPTAQLALAGVIGSGKFLVLESYNALDESSKVGAKTSYFASAKMIKTTGVVTEGAGTYVLAPISLVGVSSANIVAGGGVAVGGTAAGSAVAAGGGSVQVVNYSLGKSTAGSVAAVGTTGSLAVSMGHGVYRLGKAIGIPIGVGLGSGVVMSYEMTAQLSAHSILAVSDFSYLVLSLEGEKWVIYAIKDKTGKAKYLLTGAVIDLEQVKKEGNEIVKVPVSEEEMKKVLGEKEEKKKD